MTLVLCLPNMACVGSPAKSRKDLTLIDSDQMVLPVSVHRLKFERDAHLSAQGDYAEVERLFKEVNAIWSKWGITWEVNSIDTVTVKAKDFALPRLGFSARWEFRDAAAELIPEPTGDRRWQVYLVRQFPVNGSGVYVLEKSAVLYGELNKKGRRCPEILAHELGHSLGLSHVPLPGNLMYVGPVRTPSADLKLTPKQIRRALIQATAGPVYKRLDKQSNKRRHRRVPKSLP